MRDNLGEGNCESQIAARQWGVDFRSEASRCLAGPSGSGTKSQPKEEVLGRISLQTSGQKLRSGPPNPGKQALWHGHPAWTSMKQDKKKKKPNFSKKSTGMLPKHESSKSQGKTKTHTPPAKKLLTQNSSGGIIFGAIATIRRNQLRKRILQEIFSKELHKFRVTQH